MACLTKIMTSKTIHVGVGEYAVSLHQGDMIRTQGLGSCIGIVAISKTSSFAGLLHVQLPESSINEELAARKPGLFADTGISLFINEFLQRGCRTQDIIIKLTGGAQIIDSVSSFNIGKRNYLAVKKCLWALKLWPVAEDVGDCLIRSVSVEVGKPEVTVFIPGLGSKII